MKTTTKVISGIFTLIYLLVINSAVKAQPTFEWAKPIKEWATMVSVDENGNTIMAGSVDNNEFGEHFGKSDCYIVKYDSLWNIVWQDQFGSANDDRIQCSAQDNNGNIYLAGNTNGEKNEWGTFMKGDLIICKYDKNGTPLKQKIFGSTEIDRVTSIHVDDSNNIFIAGNTDGNLGGDNLGLGDYFALKLDSAFSEVFGVQDGTEYRDVLYCIAFDQDSNFYLSGSSYGDSNNDAEAFIAKYSNQGEKVWLKFFGSTGGEWVSRITIDSLDNIYVVGMTDGEFPGPKQGTKYSDVFFAKMDSEGEIIWEKQFGTNVFDEIWDVEYVDINSGSILMTGIFDGLGSQPRSFTRLYDLNGNLIWNQSFGKNVNGGGFISEFEISSGNSIYISGNYNDPTKNFFSKSNKNYTGFLAKFKLEDTPKSPLEIQNSLSGVHNYDSPFTIPANHIASEINNDTIYYEAKIKGVDKFETWMAPNSSTLLFDGTTEIESIYDNDTTFHDVIVRSNKNLPSWLSFNNATGEFSGTPTKDEELEIILIAKNTTSYVITDEFTLSAKAPTNGIEQLNEKEFSIFPNPASETIHIALNKRLMQNPVYQLIDMSGKTVVQGMLNSETIDVSEIRKGIYIFRLRTDREILSKKIVIE